MSHFRFTTRHFDYADQSIAACTPPPIWPHFRRRCILPPTHDTRTVITAVAADAFFCVTLLITFHMLDALHALFARVDCFVCALLLMPHTHRHAMLPLS